MLPLLFNPTSTCDVNITAIEKAIRARITADTGSGGLFASGAALVNGCYNTLAPSTATPPYIVYQVGSAERMDGFEAAIRVVSVDVDVYVPAESTTTGLSDPIKRGGEILQRIEGDWFLQTDRTPTYGLDRHILTLSGTTWEPDMLEGQNTAANHLDGMYLWTDSYTMHISIESP